MFTNSSLLRFSLALRLAICLSIAGTMGTPSDVRAEGGGLDTLYKSAPPPSPIQKPIIIEACDDALEIQDATTTGEAVIVWGFKLLY